ncbi:MAG TPA: RNA polymerase sigma factor SigM [Micromonosporaceae bacterium]
MTGVRDVDDGALLRAHVDGDRDAFAQLVRRHRDRLWAVALRTLGDREEAADAVQDALISAYRSADRFRGDSAVTTWLHRIVVNACLDRIRRRQNRPTVPLPESEDVSWAAGSAEARYDSDTAMTVWAALNQLPDEQRISLVLLDMEGYSVAEIASILGVAEGTVKSRCARGRARLAVLLGHLRSDHAGRDAGHGNRSGRDSVGPSEAGSPSGGAGTDPRSTGPAGTERAEQGGVA